MFRFKQFCVRHDRCGMKVGTDGVLLGAWAGVGGAETALDIGTGTGLIALMLAQRNAGVRVLGIDIDGDAVAQATENVAESPWPDRIDIWQADFCQDCLQGVQFDLIVSNPPFFQEDTACPDFRRDQARRSSSLPMPILIGKAAELLSERGRLSLIVPATAHAEVIGEAAANRLYLCRRTDIKTTPRKLPRRTLLEFSRSMVSCEHSVLALNSEAYQVLTGDFYL